MTDVHKDFLVGFAAIAVLALFAATGYALASQHDQGVETSRFTTCISRWADETSSRSSILTALSTKRTDRLDQLLRDVQKDVTNPARTPSDVRRQKRQFRADLATYVGASDAYQRALHGNPVPLPPRAVCR